MTTDKRLASRGAITFHTPFDISLLKPEEATVDESYTSGSRKTQFVMAKDRGGCIQGGKGDKASGLQHSQRRDWLSYTPTRQIQAKIEAEKQLVRELIQPLVDTENGFMKEVEGFLSRRDAAERRKKEMLHRRWSERVWTPLQQRVERHVSRRRSPAEAKRRQSLYGQYLQHCSAKGFVFLDSCDLSEYNPFLLNVKNPHDFKLAKSQLKDSLVPVLHERLQEKKSDSSCEAGCKYTRRIAQSQSKIQRGRTNRPGRVLNHAGATAQLDDAGML